LQAARPNIILLASVLQYLPDPYAVLDELLESNIEYMIIDRTPFSDAGDDMITVQHVPPSIYQASYPCWVFSKSAIIARLSSRYQCIAQFSNNDYGASVGGTRFEFGGMILRRI
jgi:putative methyltransferase (TIGR04325 family)